MKKLLSKVVFIVFITQVMMNAKTHGRRKNGMMY